MASVNLSVYTYKLNGDGYWNENIANTSGDGDSCSIDAVATERDCGYIIFNTTPISNFSAANVFNSFIYYGSFRVRNASGWAGTGRNVTFFINQFNLINFGSNCDYSSDFKNGRNNWTVDAAYTLGEAGVSRPGYNMTDGSSWSPVQDLTIIDTTHALNDTILNARSSSKSLAVLTSLKNNKLLKSGMGMRNVYLALNYTPGCYVRIFNDSTDTTPVLTYTASNAATYTPPTGILDTINHKGYTCLGYSYKGFSNQNRTSIPTDNVDIDLVRDWTKLYRVIFYKDNGDIYTDNNKQKRLTNSVTVPTNLFMTGYEFKGWTTSPDTGKSYKVIYDNTDYTTIPAVADNQVNGIATDDGFEIKYYPVFKKEYQVIFNKVLNEASFSYTQSNYNNKIVGNVPDKPTEPTITAYQFLGWARDSSITANTANSSNCWTTIPAIADNQAGSAATSNGFPINYYAVWQERDSITIEQVLPNSQVTEPATITVTGAAASNNNTYYFNPSSNISFSVAIKQEHEIYFIDSVSANTTTDLITNGSLTTNRKAYTSGQITTGTNATAITITIVYIEGLPIFYPSGENDFKRAMYAYWENTRAIGLYYENTRLL